MFDVVSFSALIKAYLQLGNFAKGRALIEEMKKEGCQPNKVTLNEFINAMIAKGRSWGFTEIWAIVEEMQDITRTVDLANTMDGAMDEVLLSSLVEACVCLGRPDLFSAGPEVLRTPLAQSVARTPSAASPRPTATRRTSTACGAAEGR